MKTFVKHPLSGLFTLMAWLVFVSLLLKAWLDVDWSWDTWNYHLPFAARLWGILPENIFIFDAETQQRFSGFPVLAEWFQGAFWALFQRIQAANLFSLLTFVGFVEFLKRSFSVPRATTFFALLAIPLVQIHSTLCYVDLPGSLWVATALLCAYKLWTLPRVSATESNLQQKLFIVLFALMAIGASNIKLVYLPLLFILGVMVLIRLLQSVSDAQGKAKAVAIGMVVGVLMLATPFKNWYQYGNAFYGVQVHVGSWHISEGESYTHDVPTHLEKVSTAVRWVESVWEPRRKQLFWTHDQHEGGVFTMKGPSDRLGGFFREYVVFNVTLFFLLVFIGKSRVHFQAVAWMTGLTLMTAFTPMSFQLRYSLYWMITLVAFNLVLLYLPETGFSKQAYRLRLLATGSSLAFFVFFVVGALATKLHYIIPENRSVEVLKAGIVQQSLAQVSPQEHYCIVGVQPFSMLFTSLFNTPYTYTLEGTGWPPKIIEDSQWPPRYQAELLPGGCPH